MTISKPLSAAQVRTYHAEEFSNARHNYYAQGDDIRGQWHGRLAERWGLSGDVHELHVWEVTSGFPALSAHVLVESGVDCHQRRLTIEGLLESGFGIEHTTLQVDHRDDVLPASALIRRIHPERDGLH